LLLLQREWTLKKEFKLIWIQKKKIIILWALYYILGIYRWWWLLFFFFIFCEIISLFNFILLKTRKIEEYAFKKQEEYSGGTKKISSKPASYHECTLFGIYAASYMNKFIFMLMYTIYAIYIIYIVLIFHVYIWPCLEIEDAQLICAEFHFICWMVLLKKKTSSYDSRESIVTVTGFLGGLRHHRIQLYRYFDEFTIQLAEIHSNTKLVCFKNNLNCSEQSKHPV
jgi:hypothetical protein